MKFLLSFAIILTKIIPLWMSDHSFIHHWKLDDLLASLYYRSFQIIHQWRWVFAVKSNSCKKARFIAKGFTQIFGIDYEETFSLVTRFETFQLLLSLTVLHDWKIKALDVKTTYLFGELDEEIYMDQPEDFIVKGQEKKVCRLKNSIYGLKQSALQWNKQLRKSLLEMGFTYLL